MLQNHAKVFKLSKKSKKLVCPECRSSLIWKDGMRHTRNGDIQRYICRSCGFRFSESITNRQVKVNISGQVFEEPDSGKNLPEANILQCDLSLKPSVENLPFQSGEDVASHSGSKVTIVEKGLNRFRDYSSDCQVCARQDAKNLVKVKTRQKQAAGATKETEADTKGKIIEFLWYLKKNGYSPSTIELYNTWLHVLMKLGANLRCPESVKETIALQEKWSVATKYNVVATFKSFANFLGLNWTPPKYKVHRRFPFIPQESEVDTLIAGAGKQTAALLQLLKETAMRVGEAARLQWTDIDLERCTIAVNNPEKNSNPRIFKVSSKLVAMLKRLPEKGERVFSTNPSCWRSTFRQTRKRLASKLQNPRLLQISFHTLRHWKATMEYHKTRDIYHVKQLLGHKNIRNTEIYINLEQAVFNSVNDEFHVKTAERPEEIKALLEVGFEYVCEKDGLAFFRKRK